EEEKKKKKKKRRNKRRGQSQSVMDGDSAEANVVQPKPAAAASIPVPEWVTKLADFYLYVCDAYNTGTVPAIPEYLNDAHDELSLESPE
ncbi:hypothetical protein PMAYCL1PPCAC_01482, partial [Pristionchus mayeri]